MHACFVLHELVNLSFQHGKLKGSVHTHVSLCVHALDLQFSERRTDCSIRVVDFRYILSKLLIRTINELIHYLL